MSEPVPSSPGNGRAPAPGSPGGAPEDAPTGDLPVAQDPLIGLLVDQRYRIQSRIARGGMATVYVAHDERLDRPVALKVMHPHLAESGDFVARFRREARAAARIVHPGVVSVFDQGVVHGQGYLVMELVDGPNLRSVLRSQGSLTIDESLRVSLEVLDALRAAHRVGVIHRDVKPENVLVPPEGPVKVTDFGLARAASEVSMSTTGSMLGTVAYMAPEIATTGRTDPRTDIYSVGVMLVEMLTGSIPWQGESAMQMAYSHVHRDVPPPSSLQPWLPREIDDLVASLTARDPDERPSSAGEALDLIARTRAAIPDRLAARRAEVRAPDDRHESGALATTAISFQGHTSPLPSPLPRSSQTVVHASGVTPRATAPAQARRSRVRALTVVLIVLLLAGGAGGWWWWSQYGPGSYVDVPALEGRPASAAQADVEALGLHVTSTTQFSDDVDEGVVISSEPVGGQPVHRDTEIQLVVSAGVEMREVPRLTGISEEDARAALADSRLTVGAVSEEWSETAPAGEVISQGTDAGTSVPHDTAVDLTVSKGREPIAVPSLVGLSGDDAARDLEDAGLTGAPTEQYSTDVEQGLVISQEAEAGSELHRGDTVAYVVSRGPEMIEVPDVTGQQVEQATRTLEELGFQVESQNFLGGYFNTVRSTDPAAGESVPKGSVITLTVV